MHSGRSSRSLTPAASLRYRPTLPMNVLVTGGCGFIGSNLVKLLRRVRPDWTVVNLDQLTGTSGLVVGNEYTLELFRAERHVTQSNFRIETNLEFTDCGFAVAR